MAYKSAVQIYVNFLVITLPANDMMTRSRNWDHQWCQSRHCICDFNTTIWTRKSNKEPSQKVMF